MTATLYILVFLAVGAVVYGGMAVVLLRNRALAGARLAGLAAAAAGAYIVASQAHAMAVRPLEQYLAMSVFYTAAAVIVPTTLAFVLYAGCSRTVAGRGWLGLLALPVITIALIWTNPLHELMWADPPTGPTGRLLLVPEIGPFFTWVYLPYQWGGLVIAAGILMRSALQPLGHPHSRSRLTRVESLVTLAAVVAPFLVNVHAVIIDPNPPDGQSRTAAALAISSLVLLLIFFRLEVFELEPTAYRAAVRSWRDGFLLMDADDAVIRANQAVKSLLSLPAGGVLGRPLDEVLAGEPALQAIARRRGEIHEEVAVDGDRHRAVSFQPIHTRGGEYRGRILLVRDITERRRSELALRESETMLRSIVDHSPNGVLRLRPMFGSSSTSLDFECTFANPAAGYYLGTDHKDLVGRVVSETVPALAPMLLPNLLDALRQGITVTFDFPVPVGAGDLWFRVIASPVGDDLSVTVIDVTEERLRRLEAEGAAGEDPLTALLNRRGLETAVQRLPDGQKRVTPSHSLLYLDLDRFKDVNDSYGHTAGDQVLREFAQRLRGAVREHDVLARVGGDEFVVVLVNADPALTDTVVARLLEVAARPYRVPGGIVSCPVSIGIARLPRHGQVLSGVLQAADAAMYQAKSAGGGAREAGVPVPAAGPATA